MSYSWTMISPSPQPEPMVQIAQTVFFKCRRSRAKKWGTWVAWATLIPMTDADPTSEPADPLWFELRATEEDAIMHLKACVESEIGKAEWTRQKAGK